LNAIVSTVVSSTPNTREMDSLLAHLFKEETGLTVRQFVL
jgi:hypothetical protein